MKTKLSLSLLLSLVFGLLSAQIPQGFNYQAVARNSSGLPIINQALPVRMTIQSDSSGGVVIWQELHSSVITTDQGVINLVIGKGARQSSSTVATFSAINWSVTPKFLKIEIEYSGWKTLVVSRLWSVPYAMVARDLEGPVKKLAVEGETSGLEEALFEVKNKDGQTVFAVYNEGVRIYVADGAKGMKGGFAVGGFGTDKAESQKLLMVTPDSVRIYIDDNNIKGVKGGFAVGGFGTDKAESQKYLVVTKDSTRVYVDNNTSTKKLKGGFAVGGYDMTKGNVQNYLDVSADSIRMYIDSDPSTKKLKGGFAVGGYDLTKGGTQDYLNVSPDSVRIYIDSDNSTKKLKGGFAVGGFDLTKEAGNEYIRVTNDSVKVSKSLLIPRLTTEERDNLPFTPGEALIIFNMSEGCMQIFKNKVWSNIWCFNCAPDFIIQPVDQTVCSGDTAKFFVSATGTNLIYQWQEGRGGAPWEDLTNGGTSPVYSGVKSYSLTMTNVPVSNNGYQYRCVVVGSCQPDVISEVVTLNVGSAPPVITSQPTDQYLSATCNTYFNIESPGFGVSYQWQQSTDGGTIWIDITDSYSSYPWISGTQTNGLSFQYVPSSYINYKYRCIVSNLCGVNVISDTVTLLSPITSIFTQPGSKQLDESCSVSFSIGTVNNFEIPGTYQWQESSNGGITWNNVTDGGTLPTYSGTTSSNLLLSVVPLTYDNYQYRCIYSNLCQPQEISDAATLTTNKSSAFTVQPLDRLVYGPNVINVTLDVTVSPSWASCKWQESTDGGGTWSDLTNGGSNPVYSGTSSNSLSLSNVPLSYNNYKYRCIATSHCRAASYSNTVTLTIVIPSGTVTDIDGNVYTKVGIGTQLWLGENLKATRFNNGTAISAVTDNSIWSSLTTPGYCWYNNDEATNKNTYGALYNWYSATASNLCPIGWHVPTDAEWTVLATTSGGTNIAGGKLKESGIVHWNDPNEGATNETGFTALPGGERWQNGSYNSLGIIGEWWNSLANSSQSFFMVYNDVYVSAPSSLKQEGHSIRCIKD